MLLYFRSFAGLSECAQGGLKFSVEHYAGSVMYDANSFVSKNKDLLKPELQTVWYARNLAYTKLLRIIISDCKYQSGSRRQQCSHDQNLCSSEFG